VGLLTGLLTLPLAPVRGVAWLAERILEEAEHQLYDPTVIRRKLAQIEAEVRAGRLPEEEAAALENELLGRMMARQRAGPEGGYGRPAAR
jgi:hypothetical protein